jgi:cytoskeletal protein RodZ
MPKQPMTVLGGRLRTSSVVLLVLFGGLLALYVIVRPAPAPQPSNTGNTTPSRLHKPATKPVPKKTSATPSITPRATGSSTPTSSASPTSPSSTTPSPVRSSVLPLPTHSGH